MERKQKLYLRQHFLLTLITLCFYIASMFGYIFYEIYLERMWFHMAYVVNAAGIVLGLSTFIPHLVTCFTKPDDKLCPRDFYEPVLGLLSLVPFLFVFIIHCDQWNEAQPFTGETIKLLLLSILMLGVSFVVGLVLDHKELNGANYRYHSYKPHLPFY